MLTKLTTLATLLAALALSACGASESTPEPDKCTPTASRCASTTALETCQDDGLTWVKTNCPAGATCLEHNGVLATCDAPDVTDTVEPEEVTPVCTPKAVECKGEKGIRTCADDGLSWVESECYFKCTVENNKALCKDKVCEPGSHRCGGSKNLLICKEDSLGFDTYPCPVGAQCDPNLKPSPECVAGPKCDVGTKECDETAKYLKTCVKVGTDYTFDWQKCPYGCDTATTPDACKEPVCDVGAHRCSADDPDAIEECNPQQTGWQFVQKCLTGCKDGLCENKACTKDQERCNYYAVEKCNAAGLGWEFVEGCQGTTCVQEGNNAFCAGCVPGKDYCEGDDVMTCPDPAQPAEVKQSCAVGETCVAASCLEQVVLSDALGTNDSYLALAEAVTACWMYHEGEENSALCATVDAADWSTDVTKEDFITLWYCDDDIWYDFIYDAFADGDSDALWQAEGLFSCYEPENRTVDMKADIPAGSTNEICVWFDTFATPEIVIDACSNFDTIF